MTMHLFIFDLHFAYCRDLRIYLQNIRTCFHYLFSIYAFKKLCPFLWPLRACAAPSGVEMLQSLS